MTCEHEVCTCFITAGEKFCSEACAPGTSNEPYCGCAYTQGESAPLIAYPRSTDVVTGGTVSPPAPPGHVQVVVVVDLSAMEM